MRLGPGVIAVAIASFACTCGDPSSLPPTTDVDAPLTDPVEDPLAPDGPRRGRGKAGKGRLRPPDGAPEEGAPGTPTPDPVPRPGITYKGDNRWDVERRLVDRWEDDPAALGAKVEEHGKGWEVLGCTEADDAWALGARNGDVIKRINDMPLDTTTDLLLVWAELGDEDDLHVDLRRDGQPLTFHYHIVK